MALQQENVRALDQLRQRLQQLSSSLNTLKTDLTRQETLPTWDSLQARAGLLTNDLMKLQDILDSNRQFFTAAHAYPHATFPGYSQEAVLQQLLRKKAEPSVEEWVDEHTEPNKVAKWNSSADAGLGDEEQRQLWAFAKPTNAEIATNMYSTGAFDYDYTLAEKEAGIENVVTGLKRTLRKAMDEMDEDDSEEEDEGMEDQAGEDVMPAAKPPNDPFGQLKGIDLKKPALPTEAWLKFMTAAVIPDR